MKKAKPKTPKEPAGKPVKPPKRFTASDMVVAALVGAFVGAAITAGVYQGRKAHAALSGMELRGTHDAAPIAASVAPSISYSGPIVINVETVRSPPDGHKPDGSPTDTAPPMPFMPFSSWDSFEPQGDLSVPQTIDKPVERHRGDWGRGICVINGVHASVECGQ